MEHLYLNGNLSSANINNGLEQASTVHLTYLKWSFYVTFLLPSLYEAHAAFLKTA